MKAISKREHDYWRTKLLRLVEDSENPETRQGAEEALLALQEQYEHYHKIIVHLKDCISSYEALQRAIRTDVLVPALREERKERKV